MSNDKLLERVAEIYNVNVKRTIDIYQKVKEASAYTLSTDT